MGDKQSFDLEYEVIKLEVLCDLADEVNGNAAADTWKATTDRLWVLLTAMKSLVGDLKEYAAICE